MTIDLSDRFGKGLNPEAFIRALNKNQDAFMGWYNRFEWQEEGDKAFFESLQFRDDLRCLIIAAEWCGDVVRNVPVVFRALEETQMPVEVLVMEEHLDVMDQFLTMGGRAIPIVLIVDTGGYVLSQWGPRPAYVQEAMTQFKQENPDRDAPDYQEKIAEVRKEMGSRYGEGTGYQQLIVKELREKLSAV